MRECEKDVGEMKALLEEAWLENVFNAFEANFNLFGRLERLFPDEFASERDEVVDQVVLVSPVCVGAAYRQQLRRAISRLLEKFSLSCGRRILAGFDSPTGKTGSDQVATVVIFLDY
jgi:hypothetical protein